MNINEFRERTEKAQELMQKRQIQTLILFPGTNMYYLTGFLEEPMERPLFAVFDVKRDPFFIAPDLYEEQIKESTWIRDIRTWQETENPYALFERDQEKGMIAIDDKMWSVFSENLRRILKDCELVGASSILRQLRMMKSDEEIHALKKAGEIADASLEAILDEITQGRTELELAALLEYEMKKRGGSRPSFESIVGSGPNGAMPHKRATSKRLENEESVVFDFGCVYKGYCSDMTRTVFIGDPTEEMRKVYSVVVEAQEHAFREVKANSKAKDIDLAARSYIEAKGYGKHFIHRTGHGIGLDVHEEPYITKENDQVLQRGMTFSIEPGVYLPGKFGVRIEDIVAVTDSGAISLNKFTKELLVK
ncbi:MAG TPA: aminopeptidase P family protein [Thermoplasmata archaeon]|nr:aminopeptidase P family protein [Thermoplasmata archaeon]